MKLNTKVDTSGYWLLTTALVQGEHGLWYCYTLDELANKPNDGNNDAFYVTRQNLEVLSTKGDRVLIRGTISISDRFILSGTHHIAVGQLVLPIISRS